MLRPTGLRTDLQQEIAAGRGNTFTRTASAKLTIVLLQDEGFRAATLSWDIASTQETCN
jgi:hypothetical protein